VSNAPIDPPPGWSHVLDAAAILDFLVADIFSLPEAAEARAIRVLDEQQDDHGDDLICGCWEAAEAATSLLQLLGRTVDAMLVLTRAHPVYAPTIQATARAAVEQSLRISWLLAPQDAPTRERRFAELLKETRRLYRDLGQISEAEHQDWADAMDASLAELPGDPQSRIPTIESLASIFGENPNLYAVYRLLSQPVHGTATGASVFDREFRLLQASAGRGSRVWVDAELVALPFIVVWDVASVVLRRYRDLLAPESPLPSLERSDEFVKVLQNVPANIGWQLAQRSTGRLE